MLPEMETSTIIPAGNKAPDTNHLDSSYPSEGPRNDGEEDAIIV
jgi:hypothetical protein